MECFPETSHPSKEAGATYMTSKFPSTCLHLLYVPLLRTCFHLCLISLCFSLKEVCLQPWKTVSSLLRVSQSVWFCLLLTFYQHLFSAPEGMSTCSSFTEDRPDCEFFRTQGFRFIFSKVTQWMAFCQNRQQILLQQRIKQTNKHPPPMRLK